MNLEFFDDFPILETERLVLREFRESDVDALFAVYSDLEVAKYDWFAPHETKADSLRFIKGFQRLFAEREEITWAIARKEDDLLIGTCALGDFHQEARRCEIGYCLKRSEWNKGHVTEAIQRVVTFAFEEVKLNRIEANITPGNEASGRVLEKNGFIREGYLRERDILKGELVSSIMMAILEKDYQQLSGKE